MSAQQDFLKELQCKYPGILVDTGSVECGPGWLSVLADLLQELDEHLNAIPAVEMQIRQIKEKFGELRVLYSGGDQACAEMVARAAARAQFTCDQCGQPGQLQQAGGSTVRCENHVPSVAGEEVAWLLDSVASGDLLITPADQTLDEHGSLKPAPLSSPRKVYCGIWVGLVADWHIGIYIDCDRVDYVEWAVSPDGRTGRYDSWYDKGEEPLSLLLDNQQEAFERVIMALPNNGEV